MRRVLKYPWPLLGDRVEFGMPKGAEILAFQVQRDMPCIWAVGDDANGREMRAFVLCGTGHEAPDGKFIGTIQMQGGDLVLHAFETTVK